MFNLALVNPTEITVATSARVRKNLPDYIRVIAANPNTEVTRYEGIPAQTVADAIRDCRGIVMTERLLPAVEDARLQGLVSEQEAKKLRKEIKSAHKETKQQA
jgi:hypothetical protein